MTSHLGARAARPCERDHPVRRRPAFSHLLLPLVLAALARETSAQTKDSSRTVADSAHRMEKILITAIRASDVAPIAQKTIPRAAIAQRQFGQDVPLLLANTSPALTAHTETGTNWGYSYLRLRGVDQTRINITLDGVPLNDMEDQVLYFANFADLMSSVQSVQVQRGVGTSSAGTASLASGPMAPSAPIAAKQTG